MVRRRESRIEQTWQDDFPSLRRQQMAMHEKQRRRMLADPMPKVPRPRFNPLVSDLFIDVPPSHAFPR